MKSLKFKRRFYWTTDTKSSLQKHRISLKAPYILLEGRHEWDLGFIPNRELIQEFEDWKENKEIIKNTIREKMKKLFLQRIPQCSFGPKTNPTLWLKKQAYFVRAAAVGQKCMKYARECPHQNGRLPKSRSPPYNKARTFWQACIQRHRPSKNHVNCDSCIQRCRRL